MPSQGPGAESTSHSELAGRGRMGDPHKLTAGVDPSGVQVPEMDGGDMLVGVALEQAVNTKIRTHKVKQRCITAGCVGQARRGIYAHERPATAHPF